jgi:hypothetical protein
LTGSDFSGDEFGRFGFVVIVVGDERAMQAEAREESAGGAGVFASDEIDGAEDGTGALGEIGEVADGRGHDVERAGRGDQRRVGGGLVHAQA